MAVANASSNVPKLPRPPGQATPPLPIIWRPRCTTVLLLAPKQEMPVYHAPFIYIYIARCSTQYRLALKKVLQIDLVL
jgi:hypothetical protein